MRRDFTPVAPALQRATEQPCLRIGLRPSEAAQALGISERHLRDLGADGPPVARLGSAIVYPVTALEQWLRDRAQTPVATSGSSITNVDRDRLRAAEADARRRAVREVST